MTFAARYPGRCASCGGRIVPDEECRYDDDDHVVHADCTDAIADEPTPEPCPHCFMVPAVNGECGCS